MVFVDSVVTLHRRDRIEAEYHQVQTDTKTTCIAVVMSFHW